MIAYHSLVTLKKDSSKLGTVTSISREDDIDKCWVKWDDEYISEHKFSELREVGTLHSNMK